MQLEKLKKQLQEKTNQMLTTCPKQSHKRTRLFLEMQNLQRQINKIESHIL
jgi:hypothetical protein